MYLLSTLLNSPPPPYELLFPHKEGVPDDVTVKMATEAADALVVQADTKAENSEVNVPTK
jgi:hypothetical protein